MASTVFTNVRILDCSGDKPYDGEVHIQGNRIKEIATGGNQVARDDAEVIDVDFFRNLKERLRW